jgi:hypothetical protein
LCAQLRAMVGFLSRVQCFWCEGDGIVDPASPELALFEVAPFPSGGAGPTVITVAACGGSEEPNEHSVARPLVAGSCADQPDTATDVDGEHLPLRVATSSALSATVFLADWPPHRSSRPKGASTGRQRLWRIVGRPS